MTDHKPFYICNVVSDVEESYGKFSRAFDIQGLDDKPMENILFDKVKINAGEFGNVIAVKNFQLKDVYVSTKHTNCPENDIYDHR